MSNDPLARYPINLNVFWMDQNISILARGVNYGDTLFDLLSRLELGIHTGDPNNTFVYYTVNDLRLFRAFMPKFPVPITPNKVIASTVKRLGDLETSCREWSLKWRWRLQIDSHLMPFLTPLSYVGCTGFNIEVRIIEIQRYMHIPMIDRAPKQRIEANFKGPALLTPYNYTSTASHSVEPVEASTNSRKTLGNFGEMAVMTPQSISDISDSTAPSKF
ncbi:hypothetical protein PM082_016665 [Marasmius tenuissimus]|nr:hypothetical protein PM082_016665 [Marasmius tenuissimus]